MALQWSSRRCCSLVILLCAAFGAAQEKSHPVLVQITELRPSNYTCTVVTEDNLVRREVQSIVRGQVSRPEIFEGNVSADDIQLLTKLVNSPDFREAARNNPAGTTVVSPTGRILAVEVNLGSELERVAFADGTGTMPTPPYLLGLVSFADDVENRKLPKVKGKVARMCRPLSQH